MVVAIFSPVPSNEEVSKFCTIFSRKALIPPAKLASTSTFSGIAFSSIFFGTTGSLIISPPVVGIVGGW